MLWLLFSVAPSELSSGQLSKHVIGGAGRITWKVVALHFMAVTRQWPGVKWTWPSDSTQSANWSHPSLSWSHCFRCSLVIPMLPFLTGHWRINEQVAKRQRDYEDGFSLQNIKKQQKKRQNHMRPYMHIQKQHFQPQRKIIILFILHWVRFTYTSFEFARIILMVQCHSLILGPIDLRDKAAVEFHYEGELAACRDPGSQTRFNGGKSLS